MNSLRNRIVQMSLALALGLGTVVYGGEKDDAAFAKALAAVQAAAKKSLGDKKLEEFGKESVGGKIVFEVGYKVDKVDHAYIFSETGELIEETADLEVDKLPAEVTDAIKKAHPDGKIDEAATGKTAEGKSFFEVEVKVGDELHAIKLSKKGKIKSDEVVKELSMDDKPAK